MPVGQLLGWMEVPLEVSSAEHCLEDLLLLMAVEVWNLEVVVEVESKCHCLDWYQGGLLLEGLLRLNYWNLLLLCLGVHCPLDHLCHLLPIFVSPPGPSGGPAPPEALGRVLRGVHCLG